MASLSSLRSELNYWNGQVNALNNKLKKLKKRRNDVVTIKTVLKSAVNNNSYEVNIKLSSASSKLDSAVNYTGKESQLNAILNNKDDHTIGKDNNLTSADREIQRELNDIDRQIADSESSLATAKSKVNYIKVEILEEESLRREEAVLKAANVIANAIKNK